ncbi:uncharacterized protein LOC129310556 isoform X2 [Prosopis cineraria]|uniref:uncharacterized protein LOC129310556 isoform X2 n=1 Tax=Prosopis cineraria TaxID=364024 RepID=UPI00240EDA10|nr:uncharacterized protein LOC129310556 isoform X2 [Prosopis cineraria]
MSSVPSCPGSTTTRIRISLGLYVRDGFTCRARRGRSLLLVLGPTCSAEWPPGSIAWSSWISLNQFLAPSIQGSPIPTFLLSPMASGITDVGLAAIGEDLSALQSLDVSYCRKLTDKGLSAVAKGCPDLRILHLAGCRFVTDGILQALSENCHNLEELELQGCMSITDKGLTSLASGCEQIKHLDINKCSNVGDVGVSCLSKACSSSLKTLKLLDCYKIGDETIISLAEFCNNLETLIIGGCRDVSDDAMKSLAASGRRNLKNLRMDWCLNISDSSLSCILNQCRSLEALDIGCCEEVTDAAFQLISSEEAALNLKVLKVNNCPKITVVGIGILLGKCSYLEYLDVRSCPHVTKAGCDEAGLHFPECCKVNFSEPDAMII